MLLTAGIVALSQKVSDDKAKRQEAKLARQGRLQIGDSAVAKDAFENPAIVRSGTQNKFEEPNDVSAKSADDADSPAVYSPQVEIKDFRHTSQVEITSPVQSEKAVLKPARASAETPRTPVYHDGQRARSGTGPPPYSPNAEQAANSVQKTVTADSEAERSPRSTVSKGTYAVRVKTKGSDLKSGFPYHPALFDLRVHPEKWDSFTSEVVSATKSCPGDTMKIWGAATGIALTGMLSTSVFVGRNLERKLQEQRVKQGLADSSSGSLGDKLRLWNEEYFSKQGLFAHLELSESTVKKQGQPTLWRRPAKFYANDEERDRKRSERKFVIVITKLDDNGQPMEALHEMSAVDAPVEIGSSNGVAPAATELPAEVFVPIELPADIPLGEKKSLNEMTELPAHNPSTDKNGMERQILYAEMDGDNSHLLEKMQLGETDPARMGGMG